MLHSSQAFSEEKWRVMIPSETRASPPPLPSPLRGEGEGGGVPYSVFCVFIMITFIFPCPSLHALSIEAENLGSFFITSLSTTISSNPLGLPCFKSPLPPFPFASANPPECGRGGCGRIIGLIGVFPPFRDSDSSTTSPLNHIRQKPFFFRFSAGLSVSKSITALSP